MCLKVMDIIEGIHWQTIAMDFLVMQPGSRPMPRSRARSLKKHRFKRLIDNSKTFLRRANRPSSVESVSMVC